MAGGSATPADLHGITDKINKLVCQEGQGLDAADKPAAVTAIKTKTNLLSLPAELQIAIAKECDDKTLLSLRRVCRKLEEDTIDVFAQCYFATLRHDLTPESIEKLYEISQVSRIARHAKVLKLNIHDRHPSQLRETSDANTYKQELEIHSADAEDSTRFAEALRSMSALGACSILLIDGNDARVDFHALERALLESDHRLHKLRIKLWNPPADPIRISPDLSLEDLERLSRVGSRLEYLELELHDKWKTIIQDTGIWTLLRSASNLQGLFVQGFSGEYMAELHTSLSATNLVSLVMQGGELPTAELCEILERHSTSLRRLTLVGVVLDAPVLDTKEWCTVLQKITDDLQLEELNVRHAGCKDPDGWGPPGMHFFGVEHVYEFALRLPPLEMRQRLTELISNPLCGSVNFDTDDSLSDEDDSTLGGFIVTEHDSDLDSDLDVD